MRPSPTIPSWVGVAVTSFTWVLVNWLSGVTTRVSGGIVSPSSRMPVPASRMTRLPSDARTSTDDVLPP